MPEALRKQDLPQPAPTPHLRREPLLKLLREVRSNKQIATAVAPAPQVGERTTFEIPARYWRAMIACYAVFLATLLAATGGARAGFAIAISAVYVSMFFGTARALLHHQPARSNRRSVADHLRTARTQGSRGANADCSCRDRPVRHRHPVYPAGGNVSKQALLAPRGALPEGVEAYRTIGAFDAASLPAGLRASHNLKDGTWALLSLTAGTLRFVWEDAAGGVEELRAPAILVVPPKVYHRVEGDGPFELTISFLR
jgi:cupin 2 domain-containing protein